MTDDYPIPETYDTEDELQVEIARLQAALENEQAHNKRLLAQLENWDLIEMNAENLRLRAVVVHVAACNPDAAGDSAVVALRQIVSHAREVLAKEGKDG